MDIETGSYNYSDYTGNRSKKQDDLKKVLLGALAGAAVGSLIGSLYTEKGIETRNRVSNRSKKIANDFKEKASDVAEGIKDKVSNVTTPIVDKYQSTKKVATKLFAKEKTKGSISHLHGNYDSYDSESVEISQTKVLLALLAASLAGTAIWSFTTKKGKETRKQVVRTGQEVAGKIKVQATKFGEEIKEAYELAKEGRDDLLEKQRQQGIYVPTNNSGYSSSANI